MALCFTATDIRQAEPKKSEYWIKDPETRGLALKVATSGRKVFVLRYRTQANRQRKLTLGTFPEMTIRQARKAAARHWADIFDGDDPAKVKADKRTVTVKALVETYLRDQAKPTLAPSSFKQYQAVLRKRVVPQIGGIPLSELSRADIEALHRSMSSTPVNANRMLGVVKAMLYKAEDWGLAPRGSNPAARVKMNKEDPSRRYFTDVEQVRIFEAIEMLRHVMVKSRAGLDAIVLLFFTGCRPGEVLKLRWEDIDFVSKTATLHKTKTGEASLPLSQQAIDHLQSIASQSSSQWIFPGPDPSKHLTMLVRPWKRICEVAELPNARIKDIRHTVGTYLAFSGNLYSAQAILRHTSPKTTMRYAHPFEEAVRRDLDSAISRINNNRRK